MFGLELCDASCRVFVGGPELTIIWFLQTLGIPSLPENIKNSAVWIQILNSLI